MAMRFFLFAVPLAVAAFECPGGLAEKSRLTGTAYARYNLSSSEECCASCSADQPMCVGWVFYLEESRCVLKSDIKHVVLDEGCTSGSSSPSPTPSPPTPSPPSPPPAGSLDFASLFHGGAVLQRDGPVSVWGTGAVGVVTLSLNNVAVATVDAQSSGDWSVQLAPHEAAYNLTLSVVDGSSAASEVIVSFGDVLLCAGQSNMGMPVVNKPGGFQADNGTAEAAAADSFAGSIWLWKQPQSRYSVPTAWTSASSTSITKGFSAVCWYTGKAHFERLEGAVPVGLFETAVGGSPIEYWLSNESIAKCEVDEPKCDPKFPDAVFHDDQVVALQPYAIGAIVWDQAERDLKCNHVSQYPCLLRELAESYRSEFNSPGAAFVAVQLHDYYDVKDPGAPNYDPGFGPVNFANTAEALLAMRLAQEDGLKDLDKAAIVATYDQSCNNIAFPDDCPFSSVHNIHKQLIGARVAAQLAKLMRGEDVVVEGPRATSVSSISSGESFLVTVRFVGAATPFSLGPTRNCTACCDGSAVGDFDASADGTTWVAGTDVTLQGSDVQFRANISAPPSFVRYTGGSNFTQCALFNAEGLPALPFQMKASEIGHSPIV